MNEVINDIQGSRFLLDVNGEEVTFFMLKTMKHSIYTPPIHHPNYAVKA